MKITFLNISMLIVCLSLSSNLYSQDLTSQIKTKKDFRITVDVKNGNDKKWIDIVEQYDRYALSNTNLNENFEYTRKEPDSNSSQFSFSLEGSQIILVNLRPLYVEPNDQILLDYTYKGLDVNKVPIEILKVKGKDGIFLIDNVNTYNATMVRERKIILEKVIKRRFEMRYCISLLDSFANANVESLIKRNASYSFTNQRRRTFKDYYFEKYYNNLLIAARTNLEKLRGLEAQVLNLNKKVSFIDTLKGNQYFFSQKNIYQDFYRKKWQRNNFDLDVILDELRGYNPFTQQYLLLQVIKHDFESLGGNQAKIQKIKETIKDVEFSPYADKYIKTRDKGLGYLTDELRNLPVFNTQLKQITFGDIFKETQKPFLYLDFCGSWCVPCITAIEKYAASSRSIDYSEKIRPIWFFFENNEKSWLAVIEKFQLKKENCFLILTSKMQELFGKQFEWMGEFPHYFIFSRDGKIINSNAEPLTQLKEESLPAAKVAIAPPPRF